MVVEGDLTWGGEHTQQRRDDVLQNHTPETYIILLTDVTPINSNFLKKLWEHRAGPAKPPSWAVEDAASPGR